MQSWIAAQTTLHALPSLQLWLSHMHAVRSTHNLFAIASRVCVFGRAVVVAEMIGSVLYKDYESAASAELKLLLQDGRLVLNKLTKQIQV